MINVNSPWESEGTTDGCADTLGFSDNDGLTEGLDDPDGDGLRDGAWVGANDGLAEGIDDGSNDGSNDGSVDGSTDGDDVGTCDGTVRMTKYTTELNEEWDTIVYNKNVDVSWSTSTHLENQKVPLMLVLTHSDFQTMMDWLKD